MNKQSTEWLKRIAKRRVTVIDLQNFVFCCDGCGARWTLDDVADGKPPTRLCWLCPKGCNRELLNGKQRYEVCYREVNYGNVCPSSN